MEEVEWRSGGVQYSAVKLSVDDDYAEMDEVIGSLLNDGFCPTKIISNHSTIRKMRNYFLAQSRDIQVNKTMRPRIDFSYNGVPPLPLQVHLAIAGDTVYILYGEMEKSAINAPEFAGLDELP